MTLISILALGSYGDVAPYVALGLFESLVTRTFYDARSGAGPNC